MFNSILLEFQGVLLILKIHFIVVQVKVCYKQAICVNISDFYDEQTFIFQQNTLG